MAVDDGYDATTGYPKFKDTGAPDLAVDSNEVGKYAASVGNRIVKADLAALNSYAYKRAGLMGHALDTKTDYIHDGSGWLKRIEDTGWAALTLSNTWINFGGGYSAARYRRVNGIVYVTGLIKKNSGTAPPGETIGTLPTGFRPASQLPKIVPISTGAGSVDVTSAGLILAGAASITSTALEFSFPAEQ